MGSGTQRGQAPLAGGGQAPQRGSVCISETGKYL